MGYFVRTCRRTGELAVHFAGIAYSARDNCFAVWSSLGCLGVDAAVDLQLAGGVLFVNVRTDGLQLRHQVGHERLPAEARLDGHDEDQAAEIEEREDGLSRGLRLDGDGGRDAAALDDLEGFAGVFRGVGLDMDGQDIGAGLLIPEPHVRQLQQGLGNPPGQPPDQ